MSLYLICFKSTFVYDVRKPNNYFACNYAVYALTFVEEVFLTLLHAPDFFDID